MTTLAGTMTFWFDENGLRVDVWDLNFRTSDNKIAAYYYPRSCVDSIKTNLERAWKYDQETREKAEKMAEKPTLSPWGSRLEGALRASIAMTDKQKDAARDLVLAIDTYYGPVVRSNISPFKITTNTGGAIQIMWKDTRCHMDIYIGLSGEYSWSYRDYAQEPSVYRNGTDEAGMIEYLGIVLFAKLAQSA
jgi:hypothetical protein